MKEFSELGFFVMLYHTAMDNLYLLCNQKIHFQETWRWSELKHSLQLWLCCFDRKHLTKNLSNLSHFLNMTWTINSSLLKYQSSSILLWKFHFWTSFHSSLIKLKHNTSDSYSKSPAVSIYTVKVKQNRSVLTLSSVMIFWWTTEHVLSFVWIVRTYKDTLSLWINAMKD